MELKQTKNTPREEIRDYGKIRMLKAKTVSRFIQTDSTDDDVYLAFQSPPWRHKYVLQLDNAAEI